MFSRSLLFAALCLLVGCGASSSSGPDAGAPDAGQPPGGPDASTGDAGQPDAGAPDAGNADAGTPDAGTPDAGNPDSGTPDAGHADAGSWRSSLSVCWTDATCPRVMALAHGGAWDLSAAPYDSNAAIALAYTGGADGVKVDVRVSSDNVPVISHSSPLQLYESVDCYNQTIENMTAAQVTACHRFPSTSEKFQRLDEVLNYLRGKMVVQLCVKRPQDIARTVQEIHAQHAEDFAFIELGTTDLQTSIPTISGADTVWYLVNVASNLVEVDTLLNVINNPRAFMYEFDPTASLGTMITARLHPAGIRAFTYTNAASPTVADLKALYDLGYDVVSAQNSPNNVTARQQTNTAHGVAPP